MSKCNTMWANTVSVTTCFWCTASSFVLGASSNHNVVCGTHVSRKGASTSGLSLLFPAENIFLSQSNQSNKYVHAMLRVHPSAPQRLIMWRCSKPNPNISRRIKHTYRQWNMCVCVCVCVCERVDKIWKKMPSSSGGRATWSTWPTATGSRSLERFEWMLREDISLVRFEMLRE